MRKNGEKLVNCEKEHGITKDCTLVLDSSAKRIGKHLFLVLSPWH